MEYFSNLITPIGTVQIVADESAITAIYYLVNENFDIENESRLTRRAKNQLIEYFRGERKEFSLPLNPKVSPFAKNVYAELMKVPYGEVISYHNLALAAGDENADRAVGGAMASNPIPIIIPCHRVIPSDGTVGRYGGGQMRKIYLLTLEGNEISDGKVIK